MALKLMDNPPTEDQMNYFFEEFGTHSVQTVGMGAKFVATSEYDK